MTDKLSIPAKEEQDLHIAKHIEPDSLPAIIQPVMALAQTDAEKDMLLAEKVSPTSPWSW